MAIEPFVSRGLPSTLSAFLLKSIEKLPEARFQSGGAMAETLSACLSPTKPPVPMQLPEKKSSRSLVVALALGLVLLITGSGYFYFRQHTETSKVQTSVPRGSLLAESDPEGAQLYVDGTFRGTTPIRLELPLGKHEVRFFLPGYIEWPAQVELEKPETPLKARLVPEVADE